MDALMLSQPETVAFGIAMGEKKAKAGWVRQIVLAFWAGAFIAFAAEGSNMAAFNLLARPEPTVWANVWQAPSFPWA